MSRAHELEELRPVEAHDRLLGRWIVLIAAAAALAAGAARAADSSFTVEPGPVADEKAVFATVESRNVVAARARIGGTVVQLSVKDGDHVDQGQVIAVVGDEKLMLQVRSLDAQIAGLQSQLNQAQTELGRTETLAKSGAASRAQLDQAQTALQVAASALRARVAERAVAVQQMTEGQVLAPAAGRVLQVPVVSGTVVLNGDTVATVAERNYVMRLRVPERHARFLKVGDTVRLDGNELGEEGPSFGTIALVYPQIQDGRVLADATVQGIGDYFVGQRVRVWIAAGERWTYVVPAGYVETRFGLDYVRLRHGDGTTLEVPVQRGRNLPTQRMPDGLEILSGLHPGDVLVRP
jgi:RND family efflux transporter MFP subunit